jgi:hypothetical protein
MKYILTIYLFGYVDVGVFFYKFAWSKFDLEQN